MSELAAAIQQAIGEAPKLRLVFGVAVDIGAGVIHYTLEGSAVPVAAAHADSYTPTDGDYVAALRDTANTLVICKSVAP